jgi:hypothetical protein
MITITQIQDKIAISGLGLFDPRFLTSTIQTDIFSIYYNNEKVIARNYDEYEIANSPATNITVLNDHFNSEKVIAENNLGGGNNLRKFEDAFKGRIYVRKGRWYGLNWYYGYGYYNMNYVYTSTTYDNPVNNLSYEKGVGSTPPVNARLKGISINIARCSSNIDNLQLFVNKMSKTNGSNVVTNKTLLHQNSSNDGTLIENNKSYFIELLFDEPVSTNDIIQIFFNSSSNASGTRYLYGTDIKFIYEW